MLEIVSIKYKSIPVKKLFVLQRAYCLILSSQILVRIWGVLSWMPHSSVPFPRNFPTLSPPRSQAGHSSGNTTHLWKTWKTNYCIPPVSLTLSQELEMHMVFTKPKKNKPSNSESLLQALAQVLGSDARSNLEFNMWVGSNIHLSKNNGGLKRAPPRLFSFKTGQRPTSSGLRGCGFAKPLVTGIAKFSKKWTPLYMIPASKRESCHGKSTQLSTLFNQNS